MSPSASESRAPTPSCGPSCIPCREHRAAHGDSGDFSDDTCEDSDTPYVMNQQRSGQPFGYQKAAQSPTSAGGAALGNKEASRAWFMQKTLERKMLMERDAGITESDQTDGSVEQWVDRAASGHKRDQHYRQERENHNNCVERDENDYYQETNYNTEDDTKTDSGTPEDENDDDNEVYAVYTNEHSDNEHYNQLHTLSDEKIDDDQECEVASGGTDVTSSIQELKEKIDNHDAKIARLKRKLLIRRLKKQITKRDLEIAQLRGKIQGRRSKRLEHADMRGTE